MNIENYQLPDPTWQWVSKDWMIDMTEDVDEAGWQYALKFHGAVWHGNRNILKIGNDRLILINNHKKGNYKHFRSFVRRRRWIRLRHRPLKSQQHQQQQQQQQTEAIRIRIEKKQKTRESGGRFAIEEGISFEEDITIDIPAFKLQIDPCIIDRIENYIHAIDAYNKLKEEQQKQDGSFNSSHKSNEGPRFVYHVPCKIYIHLIFFLLQAINIRRFTIS